MGAERQIFGRSAAKISPSSRTQPQWEEWGRSADDEIVKPPRPQFRGVTQEWGQRRSGVVVLPKLMIGTVGDAYEQEADRVAQHVVNQINAPRFSQQSKALQHPEMDEENDEKLQMKPLLQSPLEGVPETSELETEIARSRSDGQPLAKSIRRPMEQAFGVNFSQVKVHTGAQADQLNRSLSSKAFTSRQDIFFRQGSYHPSDRQGQELVAHELTHVVQQTQQKAPTIQRKIDSTQKVLKFFDVTVATQLDAANDQKFTDRIWRMMESYINYSSIGTKGNKLSQEYSLAIKAVTPNSPIGKRLTQIYLQVKTNVGAKQLLPSMMIAEIDQLVDLINDIEEISNKLPPYYLHSILSRLPGLDSLTPEIEQALKDAAAVKIAPEAIEFMVDNLGLQKLTYAISLASQLPVSNNLRELLSYGSLENLVTIFAPKKQKNTFEGSEKNKSASKKQEVNISTTQLNNILGKMSGVQPANRIEEFIEFCKLPNISDPESAFSYLSQLLTFGSMIEIKQAISLDQSFPISRLIKEIDQMKEVKTSEKLKAYLNSDPQSRKTALGYQIKSQNPTSKKIGELIEIIRLEQSQRKQRLETSLEKKLTPLQATKSDTEKVQKEKEQERMGIIKQHAFTLQPLGLSAERLQKDRRFLRLMEENELSINVAGEILDKQKKVIVRLHSGESAFNPTPILKADKTQGIHRDVYEKLGKPPGKNNQYVKDDKNIFTRRYAYVEKNKHQFRDFVDRGVMQGRYPSDSSRENPPDYNEISSELRDIVPNLPKSDTFTDAYQLAYVHQELGSGIHQRGVSAATTQKHAIFSNQGIPFKTEDGVRFEIDLARIPVGNGEDLPELINHYTVAAQQQSKGVVGKYKINKENERNFDHYQWSVIKNREIFIKELRPEYLTEATLHQSATGQSVTTAFNTGMSKNDLATLGTNVGVLEYQRGFMDGRNNQKEATNIASTHQAYYSEGYQEGIDYLAGYEDGRKRPKNYGYVYKKPYSYQYGFWDGYYKRPKRKY